MYRKLYKGSIEAKFFQLQAANHIITMRKEIFETFKQAWLKTKKILNKVTIEPLMLLEGVAFNSMTVFIEDLQMRRICEIGLDHNSTVCSNPTNFGNISNEVQLEFSVFAFYDGIIKSIVPLFFILFIGAWSDKYGRKIPLFIAEAGHVLYALGLLIVASIPALPVQYLLIPTLLDSLGGGNVCFLTASNAYISDITTEEARTSRVGLANSIFFLGGPLGTFIGRFIYEQGGYQAIFGFSLSVSCLSFIYVAFFIEESHGPFAKQPTVSEKPYDKDFSIYGIEPKNEIKVELSNITIKQMILDFVNPQRITDSFRSTFKKRIGNTRVLIMLVISCSLMRRLSKSPYVFAFTKHSLSWTAGDYSIWVTYKNLVATLGSLVAVPILSGRLRISDYILGIIGAAGSLVEYLLYGLTLFAGNVLFWIAPISALLVNSCQIALRAMLSKYVASDELGKVSAVLGALDGVMPMVNFSLYMVVYHETVTSFSGAHFYVGVAASGLMIILFITIRLLEASQVYDLQSANITPENNNIESKRILMKQKSWMWAHDNLAASVVTDQWYPKEESQKNSIGVV